MTLGYEISAASRRDISNESRREADRCWGCFSPYCPRCCTLDWAAFGQTNDQGASALLLGSIIAAIAIAIGLLISGILIYRRR